MTGGLPGTYSSVSSVFGRGGVITAGAGDYTTGLIPESISNLYFTDLRAQNALSGSLSTIRSALLTLSGMIATSTFSGASALINDINTFSGILATTNSNLVSLTASLSTLSGNVMGMGSQVTTLSGVVANKIGLMNLSATGGIIYNNTTGIFGWNGTTSLVPEGLNLYFTDLRAQNALSGSIAGLISNLTILSGTVVGIGNNLSNLSGTVATLSGTITGISGSISSLFSEMNTLSGSLSSTLANLILTNTNLATATGNINALSGSLATLTSDVNALSGSLGNTNINISTLSGTISAINTGFLTLSGVVATKINLASLSAS